MHRLAQTREVESRTEKLRTIRCRFPVPSLERLETKSCFICVSTIFIRLQFRFPHSIIGSNYKTIFGTSVAFSPRVYVRPIVRWPSFLTQECRLRSRHSADRREKGKEKEEGNVQVMAFQHAKRPKKPSKLDDTLRVEQQKKENQTQQIHTSLSLPCSLCEKWQKKNERDGFICTLK